MARQKSISSIEADLAKAKVDLAKAQARVEMLSATVLALQKQKQDYEAKQIMDAYKKSGKTLSELLVFLDV